MRNENGGWNEVGRKPDGVFELQMKETGEVLRICNCQKPLILCTEFNKRMKEVMRRGFGDKREIEVVRMELGTACCGEKMEIESSSIGLLWREVQMMPEAKAASG